MAEERVGLTPRAYAGASGRTKLAGGYRVTMTALRNRVEPHRAGGHGRWLSVGRRRSFWILAAVGLVVMIAAWVWFGAAMFEEMSEQPKAVSAGTTMEGFGSVIGGIPLVVAHLAGVAILSAVAIEGRRHWTGGAYALIAVATTSAVGLCVAQLLWAGALFEMGAGASALVPID